MVINRRAIHWITSTASVFRLLVMAVGLDVHQGVAAHPAGGPPRPGARWALAQIGEIVGNRAETPRRLRAQVVQTWVSTRVAETCRIRRAPGAAWLRYRAASSAIHRVNEAMRIGQDRLQAAGHTIRRDAAFDGGTRSAELSVLDRASRAACRTVSSRRGQG